MFTIADIRSIAIQIEKNGEEVRISSRPDRAWYRADTPAYPFGVCHAQPLEFSAQP